MKVRSAYIIVLITMFTNMRANQLHGLSCPLVLSILSNVRSYVIIVYFAIFQMILVLCEEKTFVAATALCLDDHEFRFSLDNDFLSNTDQYMSRIHNRYRLPHRCT